MKTQIKMYILLALVGIFLVLLAVIYNGNKSYKEEIRNYGSFKEGSLKLVKLQHKWQDKSQDKKFLKQFIAKFKPNSYREKGHLHILDFGGLTEKSLDRMGKMLLNSDLTIKSINLKKESKKVSLHVEVII